MDSKHKINLFKKTKLKIISMPMKQAFALLLIVSLIVSAVCFILTHLIFRNFRDNVLSNLYLQPTYDLLMFVLGFIIMSCGVYFAVSLFFKLKLQEPLKILQNGAQNISNNNLDFIVNYNIEDEMGDLCNSFEKMRFTLEQNYKNMWNLAEDRRILNSAFAHDLRTPLTVLRGYVDLLPTAIEKNEFSQEKIIEIINRMSKQLNRLESFVNTMNVAQRLDDVTIHCNYIKFNDLYDTIKDNFNALAGEMNKTIEIVDIINNLTIYIDYDIILQCLENICKNALFYAKEKIILLCELKDGFLKFTFKDDGNGFTKKQLLEIPKPFAKGDKSKGLGMGLYITNILCEKHGGKLLMQNSNKGGSLVTITFSANLKSR